MKIADINAAIAAASTTSFLAAYDIKDRETIDSLAYAFTGLCEKWYDMHGKKFNPAEELFDFDAITFAINGIAKLHDMAVAVSKMMSFGE